MGGWGRLRGAEKEKSRPMSSTKGTVSWSGGPCLKEKQASRSLDRHTHSWHASKYEDTTLLKIPFLFNVIFLFFNFFQCNFSKKKTPGPSMVLSSFIFFFLRKLIFKMNLS